MSFSPAVRELFNRWKQGDLLDGLEASHQQLLDRRKEAVETVPQQQPRKHTSSNCQVLQQALLHRAERLLVGAGTMLLENNIYGLALIVRGHFEATAVLGYVCNRLESLKAGNIGFDDFALNIAYEILGAKHSQLAKARIHQTYLPASKRRTDTSTRITSKRKKACFAIAMSGCRTLRIRIFSRTVQRSRSIKQIAGSCFGTKAIFKREISN
jgi:hypothetical protein